MSIDAKTEIEPKEIVSTEHSIAINERSKPVHLLWAEWQSTVTELYPVRWYNSTIRLATSSGQTYYP